MTKIIAFSTNKGGVLKTTLTTNVAGVLSKQGKKVLIIDLDNQGNVGVSFGKNPDTFEKTIYDVLLKGLDINEAIVNVEPNIDLIPSNDDISSFDIDILKMVLSKTATFSDPSQLLNEALKNLKGKYDFILLDTPPNLGTVVANALNATDEVIIPFHPETFSIRSMVKTTQAIDRFKETNPKLNVLGVVPTKFKKNTITHNQALAVCQNYCHSQGITVTNTKIHETVNVPSIEAKFQLPITLTNSKSHAIEEFQNLAKELGL